MIRVESDEVNYNLHILLRFETETAMLEGRLRVEEAPEFRNAKIQEYFGISRPRPLKAYCRISTGPWAL
ncbi:MAG: hypothetical protein AUJ51_02930 [Elusimicrobia bacterium CG1_02_56_21]|nr:MAG: hypothetical protein AUJ51_02930 [Elusimicrobia bacterium CG1_02_56_21]